MQALIEPQTWDRITTQPPHQLPHSKQHSYTNKIYIQQNHNKELKDLRAYIDRNITQLWERVDVTSNSVAEHKIKIANSPTMDEVEKKFVLREVYDLTVNHNKEKFTRLEINNDGNLVKQLAIELRQGSPP